MMSTDEALRGETAKMGGGVYWRAEGRLHLNVADALEIEVRFGVVEFIESRNDRRESSTTLVEMGGIFEKPVSGVDEIGGDRRDTTFASDLCGFSNNEVGPIVKEAPEFVVEHGSVRSRAKRAEAV
jgi:hypothetical protein